MRYINIYILITMLLSHIFLIKCHKKPDKNNNLDKKDINSEKNNDEDTSSDNIDKNSNDQDDLKIVEIKKKFKHNDLIIELDNLIKNNSLKISKIDSKKEDHIAILELICIQNKKLANIENELKNNQRKTTDWIWYIYTTQKKGNSDKYKVYIKANMIPLYLSILPQHIYDKWINILETINKGFNKNINYLPSIDYGRLIYTCKLWEKISLENNKSITQKINKIKSIMKELERILLKHGIKKGS